MEVFRDIFQLPSDLQDRQPLVALGNFDGVHLGHQRLIRSLVVEARATGAPAVVLSFYPHPMQVLRQEKFSLLITAPRKSRILAGLGVDMLVCLPFTRELARTAPEEFITDILWARLRPQAVYVGFNFTFGHQGAGTPELLSRIGISLGFTTHTISPVKIGGKVVSSSAIRQAIGAGEMETAAQLLGYHPLVEGQVVSGAKLGRKLGFPTANLAVDPNILLPPNGVYAVQAHWGGNSRDGVMNIGTRPTFGREEKRSVEVYLLDFTGELYGEYLEVEVYSRLRGEKKFASPAQLAEQIARDVELAKKKLTSSTSQA